MTVQELIDKLEEIDDKSKTVRAVGTSASFHINDVEESTIWNEVNLVYSPMK